MSKTSDVFKSLLENWGHLKQQRSSESDFAVHGVPLTYTALDEYLARLKTLIDALDAKGYWTSSPEVAVADQPIANALSTVNGLVINARSNGIGWLLNSGFLDALNNARQLIATLTRSQASLNKEIAKVLAEKSEADLELIIASASAAKAIAKIETDAKNHWEILSENSTNASEAIATIRDARDSILALEADASQAGANIKNVQLEAKASKEAIDEIRSEALAQEEVLAKRLEVAEKRVMATDEAAKAAEDSVRKALKQVRDQGLASAFQRRSKQLRNERIAWGVLFLGSIVLLVFLAIHFSRDISVFTFEELSVNLLRRLGLAAPAIWVGWYSAKQLGRVSRIQEDYEYKTASALAYQSYREEVGVLGNDGLVEKLAGIAIDNFGDNPVRLYEQRSHDDAVTPIQAAIQDLPPEKLAAVLAAVGDRALKAKLWPFGNA